VVVRQGQIRRIGWVFKTLEVQVDQFLLGCKCPVSRSIVVQEQDPLGELPAAFFLQNVLQLHQQIWVILRVDSLALWKIMRKMPSWSQEMEERTFPADFCTRIFLGRVEQLCRHSIDCCFVSGSWWYNQVSSMVTNRNRKSFGSQRKIFQNLPKRLAPLTFLIRVQAFRDPLRGERTHVQIFMNDGQNPLTWDAQLLSYWFSRNPAVFQDYLVNLTYNLRGGPCFGLSRTRRTTGGKIATFKLGHPLFEGSIRWCMFPNVSVWIAWVSFGALPCREKTTC